MMLKHLPDNPQEMTILSFSQHPDYLFRYHIWDHSTGEVTENPGHNKYHLSSMSIASHGTLLESCLVFLEEDRVTTKLIKTSFDTGETDVTITDLEIAKASMSSCTAAHLGIGLLFGLLSWFEKSRFLAPGLKAQIGFQS